MDLDDELCLCFHVSRRKIVNYLKRVRPLVPSQITECGGAGTGCGWCIPFLKQLHKQGIAALEGLDAAEYAQRRGHYLRITGQQPPPGATPPPPELPPPGDS